MISQLPPAVILVLGALMLASIPFIVEIVKHLGRE